MRIATDEIDRVYIEYGVRDPSFMMPSHHLHPYYELYYILHGSCRFFIDNAMYDLHEGDFMVIPPHVLHCTRYPEGTVRRYTIYFRREDLEGNHVPEILDFDKTFAKKAILQIPPACQPQVAAALEQMMTEQKFADEAVPFTMQVQLKNLLLYCHRVGDLLNDTDAPAAAPDLHTTDREVIKAARYIAASYMKPITQADIAGVTGFSPNYFSRKFKEATGIGVHEYLVFVRLEHAARMLLTQKTSITDIALFCGFNDGNYFKDAFKKMYGITPREYRRNGAAARQSSQAAG